MKITIQDKSGKLYNVIAVKPYSSHPEDSYLSVVLRMNENAYHPFVVHLFNSETGGFSDGAYCHELLVALAVFNRR